MLSEYDDVGSPVASLSNMGNTCFLNSVLYVLRFSPKFLHNLHHMIDKLNILETNKAKSSSLGRNVVSLSGTGPSSRSSSSKDLVSLGNSQLPSEARVVCELHELYRLMHNFEVKGTGTCIPIALMDAISKANVIFEGNKQQDAHELLVYLLNNISEICDRGKNSFLDDFRGVIHRRTQCLECENCTVVVEPFFDIPVPIPPNMEAVNVDKYLFSRLLIQAEKLGGSNKYFCDYCLRYNEAYREVLFTKLPNVVILQLGRFTTSTSGARKVNAFFPTPFDTCCFCEDCRSFLATSSCSGDESSIQQNHKDNCRYDSYELCCVIMHVGDYLASGHYIAYVRVSDNVADYACCKDSACTAPGIVSLTSEYLKKLKPKVLKKTGNKTTNNVHHKVCDGLSCCGVKLHKNLVECATRNGGGVWLECDDDNVKAVTVDELKDKLAYKADSTATPYLLFYTKVKNSAD